MPRAARPATTGTRIRMRRFSARTRARSSRLTSSASSLPLVRSWSAIRSGSADDLERCGAEAELVEDLRPVLEVFGQRGPREVFGNHDGVAGHRAHAVQ